MNNRTFDHILDVWAEAGPTVAPDRVADAVRLEVRTTRQSAAARSWPARRFAHMNYTVRIAMGVAAIAAVALLGIRLLTPSGPTIGGPPETRRPSPTPTATPVAIELPNATGPIDAGTYFIADPAITPARFTFDVPAGWETIAGNFLGKIANRAFYVSMSPWVVDQTYTDPCQWVGAELDPPLGPTVDDLANALANQVGRDATGPTDITLAGYPGKMVELSVPDDFDITTCDNEEFRMWRALGSAGGFNYGPGQQDTIYILDVDGERLVIQAQHLPRATEQDLAELQSILDSIRIEP